MRREGGARERREMEREKEEEKECTPERITALQKEPCLAKEPQNINSITPEKTATNVANPFFNKKNIKKIIIKKKVHEKIIKSKKQIIKSITLPTMAPRAADSSH